MANSVKSEVANIILEQLAKNNNSTFDAQDVLNIFDECPIRKRLKISCAFNPADAIKPLDCGVYASLSWLDNSFFDGNLLLA